MKRPLLIIIGAIFVIILLAVWVYVLLFNTPTANEEEFTDLDFGNDTDVTLFPAGTDEDGVVNPEPIVNVNGLERLKQLTTEPIAGFGEVATENIPDAVRYVQIGTGHIFEIDLETGEEERVSGTTVPGSQIAAFAGNGESVMIQSGYGAGASFTVGVIGTSTQDITTAQIFEPIVSFTGTQSGVFLYAAQTNNSVVGKSYDPATLVTSTLFTVPFRDATIIWGSEATDTHYAYPKTTALLESFLYEVQGNLLTRLPIDGYGMSATGNNEFILFSKQTDEDYQSFTFNKETREIRPHTQTQIPEKCVFSTITLSSSFCANTSINFTDLAPDTWYAGELTFQDSLYQTFNDVSRSIVLVDSHDQTQQNIDMTHLSLGAQDAHLYFTNRNDRTLWMYVVTPISLLQDADIE